VAGIVLGCHVLSLDDWLMLQKRNKILDTMGIMSCTCSCYFTGCCCFTGFCCSTVCCSFPGYHSVDSDSRGF